MSGEIWDLYSHLLQLSITALSSHFITVKFEKVDFLGRMRFQEPTKEEEPSRPSM